MTYNVDLHLMTTELCRPIKLKHWWL